MTAILYFLLVLLCVSLVIYLTNWVVKKIMNRTTKARKDPEEQSTVQTNNPPTLKRPSSSRLRSLDAFRGITIVLMVFTNSGGGHYWWMGHSTWNGLYLADVLFPCFLWIMGVCLPISMRSQLSRAEPKGIMIGRVLKVIILKI